MEQMKERFTTLLLGEDMSGRGRGISSALALSNAITNLAGNSLLLFQPQIQLDLLLLLISLPILQLLSLENKVNWLQFHQMQKTDGENKSIGSSPPLITSCMFQGCLESFKDHKEFWYVYKDADESEKWWLPIVKVLPGGLSDESRKWMQHQKDCCTQVLKASMAINAQILSEMEIPETYIDNLPKNGKTSLGDSIYKTITDEFFDPGEILATMDMSSDENVLDLKNRMEASIVIWKRKMNQKEAKSSWISVERRELFEERVETILVLLEQRFPGLPRSSLEISKIEYNRDVGHSILESYSRVLKSLANRVMNLIEDVLYADEVAQNPSSGMTKKNQSMDSVVASPRAIRALDQTPGHTPRGIPRSMTLSGSMGRGLDQGEMETNGNSNADLMEIRIKPAKILTKAKMSYLEKLEAYGLRSPTARH
ncbi:Plant specific Rop nucleotide exchanger, PRONE, partial [Cynara cardunculus var. scolymus]